MNTQILPCTPYKASHNYPTTIPQLSHKYPTSMGRFDTKHPAIIYDDGVGLIPSI